MNVTELCRLDDRDRYGGLKVDFEEAIKTAYPKVSIMYNEPSWRSSSGEMWFRGGQDKGDVTIVVPAGEYKSNKHFHRSGHGILAIESSRKKLNIAGCPLYLIYGWVYNGDYRSLKKTYYLFGKNEDDSYFLHRVRPSCAQDGDLDQVRKWIWQLKEGEAVAARQGDLAFIPRKSVKGTLAIVEGSQIQIGNHNIVADDIRRSPNDRIFALNPQAMHHEHDPIVVPAGWYELRLARTWEGGSNGRGD